MAQAQTVCYKRLALEARQGTGLTQRDFAKLLGVHYTTIAHWESGQKPPSGSAVALLRIVRTDPKLCVDILQTPELRS